LGAVPVRSADTTGATIERPVSSHVNGGFCRTDGKDTAGGVFPSSGDTRLAFSIGPGTYSPMPNPKPSKEPYKGPATYKSVMMSLNTGTRAKPNWIGELGTIIVNRDRQTGSFKTDDGVSSGTWDCGKPLE
jgi:hypothetical protein